ncbi:hypothetical protein A3Q56_01244 [Intoshia linei]|uniref:rRNA adenine N(6)-methyltransferase n=1 Tax=Intoshia linei TaxID=1819745 RepID=A0A177B9L0_9BILA|nr:hypothetical protein A3Q56_01244 [Intoshia linei]
MNRAKRLYKCMTLLNPETAAKVADLLMSKIPKSHLIINVSPGKDLLGKALLNSGCSNILSAEPYEIDHLILNYSHLSNYKCVKAYYPFLLEQQFPLSEYNLTKKCFSDNDTEFSIVGNIHPTTFQLTLFRNFANSIIFGKFPFCYGNIVHYIIIPNSIFETLNSKFIWKSNSRISDILGLHICKVVKLQEYPISHFSVNSTYNSLKFDKMCLIQINLNLQNCTKDLKKFYHFLRFLRINKLERIIPLCEKLSNGIGQELIFNDFLMIDHIRDLDYDRLLKFYDIIKDKLNMDEISQD